MKARTISLTLAYYIQFNILKKYFILTNFILYKKLLLYIYILLINRIINN